MLGVIADDHYVAVSLDDLALFADLLNGRLYFHSNNHLSLYFSTNYLVRHVILPFVGS